MFLVYEKNYLSYGEVDCVAEEDMSLHIYEKNAREDMQTRKKMYIADKDNDFTFMEDESSEDCIVFADEYNEERDTRSGEFHICLAKLRAEL